MSIQVNRTGQGIYVVSWMGHINVRDAQQAIQLVTRTSQQHNDDFIAVILDLQGATSIPDLSNCYQDMMAHSNQTVGIFAIGAKAHIQTIIGALHDLPTHNFHFVHTLDDAVAQARKLIAARKHTE